jgi:hypothetical protein
MNDFEMPQGANLERARAFFTEIENAEAMLRSAADQSVKPRVAASSLYAAARDGHVDITPLIETMLAEHRSVRAAYRHMLATTALYALPEAMAASSGEMPVRHGEGCLIRTERSRAEPNQFFVVVELTEKEHELAPTCLIVCDTEDRTQRFPLPMARDGITQIIAEAQSDLMRMLGDPTTRIYLQ